MPARQPWSRQELLAAGFLYCRIPFGRFHRLNPEIIWTSEAMGRTPSAVAMKLSNLASLDPVITESGRSGLAAASAADRAIWEEMNADWPSFAVAAEQAVRQIGVQRDGGSEEPVSEMGPDYTGRERASTRPQRVGQDLFRAAVMSAYNHRCCITGLDVPRMLIASHIVPWREDPSNRLNPSNGLCLSALHDRAFDIGLITIREDWTVAVSLALGTESNEFWARAVDAYEGRAIMLPEKFSPSPAFLAHHREHVFHQ